MTSMVTPADTPPAPAPAANAATATKWTRGARKDRATLRLTEAEWAIVQARVRETGRTTGRFLRELVLGTVPRVQTSTVNAAAIRELARIGNNLNQLAREANAAGNFPLEARILAVLDQVVAKIHQLG